jgi:PKD repeat protein
MVTDHSVTLTGLASDTTHHYRVKSEDAGGNLAISEDYTFTTLPGGDVVTITGAIDNTLRELGSGIVLNDSTYIDVGRHADIDSYRGVIWFDLSQFDSTDQIESAALSLFWYYGSHNPDVSIYRPADWDTNYATWNTRMNGVAWDHSGGDWYDRNNAAQGTSPYAAATFTGGPDSEYHDFDVTELVQRYVDDTYKNTGFFIKANEVGNTYIAFRSSDYENADQRPKLTISLSKPSQPPTITTWSNSITNNDTLTIPINETQPVRFNAAADQIITTWRWYVDGSNQNHNHDSFTKAWDTNGTYMVSVTAGNANGTSDSISWMVHVNDITAPVITNLVNDTPTRHSVNLNWECSASDVVHYTIYRDSALLSNTENKYYNVTGLSPDTTYIFNVSATNLNGITGDNASITVRTARDDNPPVARAGLDQTVYVNTSVSLDGSDSTDDHGITSYVWDFDDRDGLQPDATGAIVSHTYTEPGAYNATLTVTDTSGKTDSDIVLITVLEETTQKTDVSKITQPIVLDGSLSEWAGADTISFAGSDNTATVSLTWDEDNLYFGFDITDTNLQASGTDEDDQLHLDDSVEIYLDTVNDGGAAMQLDDYHFIINLNGALVDDQGTGSGKNYSWTSHINYTIDLDGMAIPWSDIGGAPVTGDIIGLDLCVNDLDDPADGRKLFDWCNLASWAVPDGWGDATFMDDNTAPTVVSHSPTGTGVGTTITITFSEPMNKSSAEEAFSVSPSVAGTFSWTDNTMTFTSGMDLSYETTYTVTIDTAAADLAGNHIESAYSWQFTTETAPDTTPPVISDVGASDATISTIAITWTTDEPATSQVEYGLNTSYVSSTTIDTDLVTTHHVTLTGLLSDTPYHYRVKSMDAADNLAVSGDHRSFTIPSAMDTVGLWHFEITIEAWVKTGAIPQAGWNKIIAKPCTSYTSPYQQYALTLNYDHFVFELNAGGSKSSVHSTVSLANNTWYHVAGTYDGSEMRIYLNGEPNGTLSKNGTIAEYPTDVHIGAGIYSDAQTEYLNGTIDEVKILNIALRAEEIRADYMAGQGDATPSSNQMASHFGVNDTSGTSGTYVLVPVNIVDVTDGPIQTIKFDILYDESVLNLNSNDPKSLQPGTLTDAGWIFMLGSNNHSITLTTTWQSLAIPDGSTGSVVMLNFSVIGAPGATSYMDISEIELANTENELGTAPAESGLFSVLRLGTISGTIAYSYNKTAIAGAVVNLTKNGSLISSTITDTNGMYTFTDIEPGDYDVSVSKIHFWDNSTSMTVYIDQEMVSDLMLLLRGDLNDNGEIADAADVNMMMQAFIRDIPGNKYFDLNENGKIADFGDVEMILLASIGELIL